MTITALTLLAIAVNSARDTGEFVFLNFLVDAAFGVPLNFIGFVVPVVLLRELVARARARRRASRPGAFRA